MPEIEAIPPVKTYDGLPQRRRAKAAGAPIGSGQQEGDNQTPIAASDTLSVPRKGKSRSAQSPLKTASGVPVATLDPEIDGGHPDAGHPVAPAPVDAELIASLVELQRRRRYFSRQVMAAERSIDDYLARTPDHARRESEKNNLPAFARAKAYRQAVERAFKLEQPGLAPDAEIVLLSASSRRMWEKQLATVVKQIEATAATLPAADYVRGVRGFSVRALGVIVGEAGDLSNYATKERLWKRLGLAVVEGQRQQRVRGPDAKKHGYNAERRSEVWVFCSDVMFRAQWRGARDEDGKDPAKSGKPIAVPAHPIGPYGEIYRARRQHVEVLNADGAYAIRAMGFATAAKRNGKKPAPEHLAGRLTRGHIHSDATRIMSKALIENLWRAWNGKRPIEPVEHGTPRKIVDA